MESPLKHSFSQKRASTIPACVVSNKRPFQYIAFDVASCRKPESRSENVSFCETPRLPVNQKDSSYLLIAKTCEHLAGTHNSHQLPGETLPAL